MATRHEIVDGPGKWDLMVALGEGKVVSFTDGRGAVKEVIYVQITLLEIEDGSRQRWLIKFHRSDPAPYGLYFHGYYDSTTRHGWFEKVENQAA